MIESKRSESIANLGVALALAQGQIKTAPKDAEAGSGSFKYKYATLDNIWDACRKPLAENGLSVVQIPMSDDTGFYLETILIHLSGEWISGKMSLPVVSKKMGELQAIGSTITYARRYMLGAMVGVTSGDDDDGQRVSDKRSPAKQPAEPSKPFPDNNPTLAFFTTRAKDAGFEPAEAAEVLKAAGFNGYEPGQAPQMWAAVLAEYEARKAAQPMPQAAAVQVAADDDLAESFPEIFPDEAQVKPIEEQPF